MFIIQFLELLVDDFNFWPSDVLLDIFVRVPSFQAVERIASIAYGNGVPLRILSRFLHLVNPDWGESSSIHLYSLYHMWKLDSGAVHQTSYYNVRHKKICWLNGEDHIQDEFVLNGDEAAADVAVPLGFDGTDHEEVIVAKLNSIQNEEYFFDLLQ